MAAEADANAIGLNRDVDGEKICEGPLLKGTAFGFVEQDIVQHQRNFLPIRHDDSGYADDCHAANTYCEQPNRRQRPWNKTYAAQSYIEQGQHSEERNTGEGCRRRRDEKASNAGGNEKSGEQRLTPAITPPCKKQETGEHVSDRGGLLERTIDAEQARHRLAIGPIKA